MEKWEVSHEPRGLITIWDHYLCGSSEGMQLFPASRIQPCPSYKGGKEEKGNRVTGQRVSGRLGHNEHRRMHLDKPD